MSAQNRPSFISIEPRQEGPEKFSELRDINIESIDFDDPSKEYVIKYNPTPDRRTHNRFFEFAEATAGVGDNIYNLSSPTTETVGGLPAGTDILGWTNQEILEAILVASHNPTIDIRCSVYPFSNTYEVGQVLTTPLIETRGHLGAGPTGILTSLDIAPIGFNQANPADNTWYGMNDVNITIILGVTKTYTATILDDQARTTNVSANYIGVYPMYVGVIHDGDVFTGMTQAQLEALPHVNKLVKTKSNTNDTSNPVSERYIILYPDVYGPLTTILDDLDYDTISDYTMSTITINSMLDGTNVSYRVYQFNSDTTQINFTNKFNF